MLKCQAKMLGTGEKVEGYYCKVEGKHYIVLKDADLRALDPAVGGWGDGIYGFVEINPKTLKRTERTE